MKTLALRLSIHGIAYVMNQNNTIVADGFTRIVCKPDDMNEHTAGRNPPGMVERRLKRAARRNGERKRRRVAMVRKWIQHHLQVDVDALEGREKTAVITFREKAISKVLTKEQLALVLLTSAKRRGWKVSGEDDEDELGEFLANVERNSLAATEAGGIGAYQAGILRTGKRARTRTYFREIHEAEFVQIAQVQAAVHPAMQGEALTKLRRIIFFQRPLRSVKDKVDRCGYEPGSPVCNRMDPYFQTLRVLTDSENLRLYDARGNDIAIPDGDLAAIRETLLSGKDLSYFGLMKMLGHKKTDPVSINYEKGLAGHQTRKAIPQARHLDDADLYKVWQLLHSVKDEAARRKGLANIDGMLDDSVLSVKLLKAGYCSYSQKAIKKLLPHLLEGASVRSAVIRAGYDKPAKDGDVELRGMNLVQKKWFDHVANHVKRIEAAHGTADRIVFGSESMLLANKKKRATMAKERRMEDKLMKGYVQEVFDTLGQRHLSGKDKMRLQLWHECNGISPLHPDQPITLAQLLDDKEDPITVDHIVPLSRLFDDSMQNKVLCRRSVNKEKGDRTALEFIRLQGRDEEAYVQLVDDIRSAEGRGLPMGKRWRLKSDQENIPRNHVTRRLPRGSFVRATKRLLGDRVEWCPMAVASHLVNRWDMPLAAGDLGNHVAQAWALSVVSAEYLEQLDTLTDHPGESLRHIDPPTPAADCTSDIRLHHYRRSSFRGKGGRMEPKVALHQDTHYARIAPEKWIDRRELKKGTEVIEERGPKVKVRMPEVVVRYAVQSLVAKDIAFVVDLELRKVLTAHLAKYGNNAEKAWANYEEDPPLFHGNAVRHVRLFTGLKQTRTIKEGQYIVKEAILDHTAVYRDAQGKISFVSNSPLDVSDRMRKKLPIAEPTVEGKGELVRIVRYGDVFHVDGEAYFLNTMERDTGRLGLLPVMRTVPVKEAKVMNLRALMETELEPA